MEMTSAVREIARVARFNTMVASTA
jgi:hypothetical protein